MRSRPSTAAVLAAYQILKPGDLVPPLQISDPHFEQLRIALAAAYRVDYHTIDQVRLLRAIYLYRGAISLLGNPALGFSPTWSIAMAEAVHRAADVLEVAEKYAGYSYGTEAADESPQLGL